MELKTKLDPALDDLCDDCTAEFAMFAAETKKDVQGHTTQSPRPVRYRASVQVVRELRRAEFRIDGDRLCT
ncbi:hypothetical protein [Rhizobium anhuiense]|uniref:hypothetical protein n=1 Tax=Rhizobium anhuiense TaxID=1184720 RepID=UPI001FEDE7E9|nr:hypothetical protein [Rhizobium anhuiense]